MQLQINQDASRLLTSSSTDVNVQHILKMQNVGSFDFIYSIAIFLPVLVSFIIRSKYPILYSKAIIILIVALYGYTILISNLTTALIMLFIGVLISGISGHGSITISKFLFYCLICALVTPLLLKVFLIFMEGRIDSIYAQSKIDGILGFLNGGGTQSLDDATSRTDLLKRSIKSFFDNPIFGVGGYYRIAWKSPIGQHSQFIDEFARYGILGGCFLLLTIVRTLRVNIRSLKNGKIFNNPQIMAVMLFGVLGFMNPVFVYSIMIVTFIISPALSRLILNKYEDSVPNR